MVGLYKFKLEAGWNGFGSLIGRPTSIADCLPEVGNPRPHVLFVSGIAMCKKIVSMFVWYAVVPS